MTRAEILMQALTRATGKPEAKVRSLVENICAANPKIAAGFSRDVPEAEAREQIAKIAAEGPGIWMQLIRGHEMVARFESDTVH